MFLPHDFMKFFYNLCRRAFVYMRIDNCTHVMLYFIKQEFWEENNAFENNKDNFTALFALRLFAISLFKIEA